MAYEEASGTLEAEDVTPQPSFQVLRRLGHKRLAVVGLVVIVIIYLAGIFALGGALSLIEEVGAENISKRILALTDRLVEGLRGKGYRMVSSRSPSEASGIVAFRSDDEDLEAIRKHLEEEHHIVIAVRCGRLRASPHFYNTEAEIDQLIEALPSK